MSGLSMEVILFGLSTLYSTLAIIGVSGNVWVLLMLSGHLSGLNGNRNTTSTPTPTSYRPSGRREKTLQRGQHSSTHLYLLFLSMADLTHVFSLPLLIVDIATSSWPLGNFSCKLFICIECVNKFFSPLILALLSADRYVAICRPGLYWLREPRAASTGLALCALIAAFYTVPIVSVSNVRYVMRGQNDMVPKCMIDMPQGGLYDWFDYSQVGGFYLLPLSLICLVYGAILRKIYRHTRYSTIGRRTTISLKRVVRCSAMVVAFYFICWTPYWFQRAFVHDYETNRTDNSSHLIRDDLNWTQTQYMYDDYYYDVPSVYFRSIFFVLIMYIVHALPYTQSSFNWLFYAYLNRQLRQSSRVLQTIPACTGTQRINGSMENGSLASLTAIGMSLQETTITRNIQATNNRTISKSSRCSDYQQLFEPSCRKSSLSNRPQIDQECYLMTPFNTKSRSIRSERRNTAIAANGICSAIRSENLRRAHSSTRHLRSKPEDDSVWL